ncbi:MAG TPA: hypothetical protein VM429_03980, partial [Micropruina sp.]|nr:hypothetical protein [Micropruina sp.]
MRDLNALPKAHLHLHFTGSMSIHSLQHLAALAKLPLHESLVDADALLVPHATGGDDHRELHAGLG